MNIEIPELKFKLGQPIIGKGNRKIFVADIVYSIYEKDWLVIYHSLSEDDKIGGTYTLNLEAFNAGL